MQEDVLYLAMTAADMHDESLSGDISRTGEATALPVEKTKTEEQQVEQVEGYNGEPVFDQDEEPELRARTYIALRTPASEPCSACCPPGPSCFRKWNYYGLRPQGQV